MKVKIKWNNCKIDVILRTLMLSIKWDNVLAFPYKQTANQGGLKQDYDKLLATIGLCKVNETYYDYYNRNYIYYVTDKNIFMLAIITHGFEYQEIGSF